MKNVALLLLMVLAAPGMAAEYMFIGTYNKREPGKSYWCADREMEKVELESKEKYEAEAKNFRNRYKGQSPHTELITANEAVAIYNYRYKMSGWSCEPVAVAIVRGIDVADAHAKMMERVQKKPQDFRSNPELVFSWNGGTYKNVVKRNYDGVEITLTSVKSYSGKNIVVMKARNLNQDKAASILFIVQNKLAKEPITLQPGNLASSSVGIVGDFEIEVRLYEPEKDQPQVGTKILKQMKNSIREQVRINYGGGMKLETGNPLAGVRG